MQEGQRITSHGCGTERMKKARDTIISLELTPANNRAVVSKETRDEDAGYFSACNGSAQFSEDLRPTVHETGENIEEQGETHEQSMSACNMSAQFSTNQSSSGVGPEHVKHWFRGITFLERGYVYFTNV